MISPVILFNTIVAVIGWLQYFSEAFVITTGTGGPANAALFYVLYLYQRAFRDLQVGYASALAWLLFLLTLLLTILILRSTRRWVHYEVKGWPRAGPRRRAATDGWREGWPSTRS